MSAVQSERQLGRRRGGASVEELKEIAAFKKEQDAATAAAIVEWTNALFKEHGFVGEDGRLIYSVAFLNKAVDIGFRTLLWLAANGHYESARFLVEKGAGAPEIPLSLRVGQMGENEVVDTLRALARRRGASDVTVDGLLALFSEEGALPLPAGGEQ